MNSRWPRFFLVSLACFGLCLSSAAYGELRIRDLCRVKGQEQNTLHGLGLLVGLNGTGDGDLPTTRALAKMMELMGNPVSADQLGQPMLDELKTARNVALVFVTATIPPEGARQGEQLNCSVSAIGAKSLEGGNLMFTPLLGPRPGDPRVYGTAQGLVSLDNSAPPTTGRIHGGCRLETDFGNSFVKENTITLVLDKHHASFQNAYDIEALLNDPTTLGVFSSGDSLDYQSPYGNNNSNSNSNANANAEEPLARAIDQVNIEVRVPEAYQENAVQFVAEILDTRILTRTGDARVVINERSGVIVIGDNVEVGAVAVTHSSLSIQTGGGRRDGPLHVLDQSTTATSTTKLQALVDALNALQVETGDIIDIIKELERSGDLYGHLIVE